MKMGLTWRLLSHDLSKWVRTRNGLKTRRCLTVWCVQRSLGWKLGAIIVVSVDVFFARTVAPTLIQDFVFCAVWTEMLTFGSNLHNCMTSQQCCTTLSSQTCNSCLISIWSVSICVWYRISWEMMLEDEYLWRFTLQHWFKIC